MTSFAEQMKAAANASSTISGVETALNIEKIVNNLSRIILNNHETKIKDAESNGLSYVVLWRSKEHENLDALLKKNHLQYILKHGYNKLFQKYPEVKNKSMVDILKSNIDKSDLTIHMSKDLDSHGYSVYVAWGVGEFLDNLFKDIMERGPAAMLASLSKKHYYATLWRPNSLNTKKYLGADLDLLFWPAGIEKFETRLQNAIDTSMDFNYGVNAANSERCIVTVFNKFISNKFKHETDQTKWRFAPSMIVISLNGTRVGEAPKPRPKIN